MVGGTGRAHGHGHRSAARSHTPWRPPPLMAFMAVAALSVAVAHSEQRPWVDTWSTLKLLGEPYHENLATANQAMDVWKYGASDPGRELVVGLIHRYGDMNRRADDVEYAIAWESDGRTLQEVQRIQMSCPGVDLVVPNRGPYVYEVRLQALPWSMHPECSCISSSGRPCPNGVQATMNSSAAPWLLQSATDSHFVDLENEWQELIADGAVLNRLLVDTSAQVAAAGPRPINAGSGVSADADLACPGTRDDLLGGKEVTHQKLVDSGIRLQNNTVQGKWCLVRRGGCDETAKVKLCEVSGAVGTIVVDHGNFAGDQSIRIRYNRAEGERAQLPVLFVSQGDGEELFRQVAMAGNNVTVSVGPTIGGLPPASYSAGSGIIVHTMGLNTSGLPGGVHTNKSYPNVFGTAGWVEVSRVRDLLFACLPSENEVRIYDVSKPLVDIPYLGKIVARCSRSGMHDYRVLDYLGPDGKYMTCLVDPDDNGNRLFYYDTQDPRNPKKMVEIHANWEAAGDGLGQVRPGGQNWQYHLVTWHCADLYCGKNHGDGLYFLNTSNLSLQAFKVPLPMLSKGGFARDVACDHLDAGVCALSLTWDGLVFVDAGAKGSANPFRIIASNVGVAPWSDNYIPHWQAYLRMHSGAQKVYASRLWPKKWYVEHSDFSIRPLRLGDAIRALQLTEVFIAEVKDYNKSVDYGFPGPEFADGTSFAGTAGTAITKDPASCPWFGHSGTVDVMECMDKSRCNVLLNGWDCCKPKGGRGKCPVNHAKMCAAEACGGEHCCSQDCSDKGGYLRCKEMECPWLKPTDQNYVMECRDGTGCNTASVGWDCCYAHGGRARCPANFPLMCMDTTCDGGDRCCEEDCSDKGGELGCVLEGSSGSGTSVTQLPPQDRRKRGGRNDGEDRMKVGMPLAIALVGVLGVCCCLVSALSFLLIRSRRKAANANAQVAQQANRSGNADVSVVVGRPVDAAGGGYPEVAEAAPGKVAPWSAGTPSVVVAPSKGPQ